MGDIFKIDCSVQKYLWGKIATESLVARFTNNSSDSDRYAELWMGTHKNRPSIINESGQQLNDWIAENSTERVGEINGQFIVNNTGGIPFLMKILSIDKALSLQVHPNKDLAKILHSRFPQQYPDDNHKPEMAIALTVFEGLCGFRPVQEILENLKNHSELHMHLSAAIVDVILGKGTLTNGTDFIQQLFQELIVLPNSATLIHDKLLLTSCYTPSDELFLRIYAQHPCDPGLVCIYLLNHMVLQPGECMFLGAGKIHAYFSGDCVECMACSDNTIRAGLTVKFVDIDLMISMLDFTPGTAESQKLSLKQAGNVVAYIPPVKDFAVDKVSVTSDCILQSKKSAQIIICTEGGGTLKVGAKSVDLAAGTVVYVIPNKSVSASGNMTLFSAYCQI